MSRRYDIVCTIGHQLSKDDYPLERAVVLAKEVLWDAGQADYDYMDEEETQKELDEIRSMLERYWNMRQENNENN